MHSTLIAETDRRRLRSITTRRELLAGVKVLAEQGEFPTPHRLAAVSGVGLRTVHQYGTIRELVDEAGYRLVLVPK